MPSRGGSALPGSHGSLQHRTPPPSGLGLQRRSASGSTQIHGASHVPAFSFILLVSGVQFASPVASAPSSPQPTGLLVVMPLAQTSPLRSSVCRVNQKTPAPDSGGHAP